VSRQTGRGKDSSGARRPDASMALIQDTFNRTLDPAYEEVAKRRESQGLPAATVWGTPAIVVGAVLTGLLIGMAGGTLRERSQSVSEARTELIAQIQEQQDVADQRSESIRQLQEDISSAESSALNRTGPAMEAQISRLLVTTGTQAVTGPGMLVSLDDGPTPDGEDAQSDRSVNAVAAADLQWITNALWEAGAEAIAVNGQRLTVRSAIRSAGPAILVNFRPLTRPYTIYAIGDPDQLASNLGSGPGGAYLGVLHDNFGISVDTSTSESITLPGAVIGSLRSAKVVDEGTDSATASPTSGGTTP
jgi:uncharacterized protein YlxW (UPF0749 family)